MKELFRLRPSEAVTLLFLSCLILISAVFYSRIPRVPILFVTYALLILLQIFIIKKHDSFKRYLFADMLQTVVFPIICVLVIFDSLEGLVHYINPKDIDPLLIRLDYLIFGGYPTVMLESIANPLITEILQMAYTSYYFLPISLGLILKIQKREEAFHKTVFLILLCFYLSYIGYMLFPALGPRYTMNHLQSTDLKGLFVAEQIQELLNSVEGIKRDAFPSGHTGIVLVVSGLAYRYHKGFFYVTLPVITLLIFATVYCRYHYVTDVIGGAALAVITFFTGDKYYGYWETRDNFNS